MALSSVLDDENNMTKGNRRAHQTVMTKPGLLELPTGVRLVYLAEGRANVVFRFMPAKNADDSSLLPLHLEAKLLRLRKETPSALPCEEISRHFDDVIRPMFAPEELVDQWLVRLPGSLVHECNERLRASERSGERPAKRRGVYLSTAEPMGLLVTDMTTFETPGFSLLELKPKWLLQSPSAPLGSRQCRSCALRAMRNHEARQVVIGELEGLEEEGQRRSFCPLDLVSDDFEDVVHASRHVKGCSDPQRLARILYRNRTLLRLREHQAAMKDVGLHGPQPRSSEQSLAMALRDCTMFIRVGDIHIFFDGDLAANTQILLQLPHDDRLPVEIRLGDLDLKIGSGDKARYWLELEMRLIREGWYAGSRVEETCHVECSMGRYQ